MKRVASLPRRVDRRITVEHGQKSSRCQTFLKSRQHAIQLHPVDARPRDYQSVRRTKLGVLDSRAYPPDPWVAALGERTGDVQHRFGRVNRVRSIDLIHEPVDDFAGAASGIKQSSWLASQQTRQDVVNFA